ncbi:hypothetical protein Dip518_001491 [Parelusimicrobium proximum]|uniref:hypothetical protein n=1 Tax=Parelusimicrobium proximum TaxID=3228953 RepID=UPI003D16CC25
MENEEIQQQSAVCDCECTTDAGGNLFDIIASYSPTPPAGMVKLEKAWHYRAMYPEAYDKLVSLHSTHGNMFVTEADYNYEMQQKGFCFKFVLDSANQKFYVPTFNGAFLRASRYVTPNTGLSYMDCMQDISGSIDLYTPAGNAAKTSNGSGILWPKEMSNKVYHDGAGALVETTTGIQIKTDSLRIGDETAPKHGYVYYYLRLANLIRTPSTMRTEAIMENMDFKVNKDFSNISEEFVKGIVKNRFDDSMTVENIDLSGGLIEVHAFHNLPVDRSARAEVVYECKTALAGHFTVGKQYPVFCAAGVWVPPMVTLADNKVYFKQGSGASASHYMATVSDSGAILYLTAATAVHLRYRFKVWY